MKRVRVLFVCMGNICRSPTAEAVARRKAELAGIAHRFEFDSAGTHGYHLGAAPDRRAVVAAARRGYDLSALRARRLEAADFERFDWVLAMDDVNYAHLAALCPPGSTGRLKRLLDFAPQAGRSDVPDPYYGNAEGFEIVIDLIEMGVDGLLAEGAGGGT